MSEMKNNNLENQIRELDREIESYRRAIIDAESALDAAEKELNAVLDAELGKAQA